MSLVVTAGGFTLRGSPLVLLIDVGLTRSIAPWHLQATSEAYASLLMYSLVARCASFHLDQTKM